LPPRPSGTALGLLELVLHALTPPQPSLFTHFTWRCPGAGDGGAVGGCGRGGRSGQRGCWFDGLRPPSSVSW
jgi:hypothetical protein